MAIMYEYALSFTPTHRKHYDEIKSWLRTNYGPANINTYTIQLYFDRFGHTDVDICFYSCEIWTHFRLVWADDREWI